MHESRTPLLAANWKQNMTWSAVEHFVAELRSRLPEYFPQDTQDSGEEDERELPLDIVLCAPYPYIGLVGGLLDDAHVYLGAQDVSRFSGGAHTGEVSAAMLGDLGCDYCIVGHSERRWELGEDDTALAAKLAALATEEIVPIFCVGEPAEQRRHGKAREFTLAQLDEMQTHLSELPEIVIAYEPVWAIGTGDNATPDDAQEMASAIREWLSHKLGPERAAATPILYGGSVKPDNIAGYLAAPDIDGALVGGASLEPASLVELHSACAALVAHAAG
jgi:triosephosphate isomerase